MNAIANTTRAERHITRKTAVGARTLGFAGPGHSAVEVFGPQQLTDTSPFVMLTEDTGGVIHSEDVEATGYANASIEQDLPGHHRALLYVVEGSLRIGDGAIEAGYVGWLDPALVTDTFIRMDAVPAGARVLLYAGAPLTDAIVHRGPFVAGSAPEIAAQFAAYRAGRFQRISEIARR